MDIDYLEGFVADEEEFGVHLLAGEVVEVDEVWAGGLVVKGNVQLVGEGVGVNGGGVANAKYVAIVVCF